MCTHFVISLFISIGSLKLQSCRGAGPSLADFPFSFFSMYVRITYHHICDGSLTVSPSIAIGFLFSFLLHIYKIQFSLAGQFQVTDALARSTFNLPVHLRRSCRGNVASSKLPNCPPPPLRKSISFYLFFFLFFKEISLFFCYCWGSYQRKRVKPPRLNPIPLLFPKSPDPTHRAHSRILVHHRVSTASVDIAIALQKLRYKQELSLVEQQRDASNLFFFCCPQFKGLQFGLLCVSQ